MPRALQRPPRRLKASRSAVACRAAPLSPRSGRSAAPPPTPASSVCLSSLPASARRSTRSPASVKKAAPCTIPFAKIWSTRASFCRPSTPRSRSLPCAAPSGAATLCGSTRALAGRTASASGAGAPTSPPSRPPSSRTCWRMRKARCRVARSSPASPSPWLRAASRAASYGRMGRRRCLWRRAAARTSPRARASSSPAGSSRSASPPST
mmetsp:Transcript_2220/g.6889  ORF Transcript_2220/g.6889 Transcript_2220/m.6889 type:complete len:209 (-) Transcript_2220:877-1503(-)